MVARAPRPPVAFGWILLAVGAGLLAAGCGGNSHSSNSGSATTPVPSAPASGGNTVTVDETEFHLALSPSSTTVSAGSYTFVAVNKGKIAHSLAITGPGVNAQTKTLNPGQSADLHVTLQAGSYDVFCPIDSHKSLGMNQEVTVSAASAGGAPATSAAVILGSGMSRGD